jgi:hypothetical protein
MNGKIIERDPSQISISKIVGGPTANAAKLMPLSQNTGFPSAKFATSLAAPTKKREKQGIDVSKTTSARPLSVFAGSVDASAESSSSAATDVAAMSDAERMAAVQEIESMLSPESIAILRNRGKNLSSVDSNANKRQQAAVAFREKETTAKSISDSNDSQSMKGTQNKRERNPVNRKMRTPAPTGPLATTLDELHKAQKDAPSEVQAALAWSTLEDTVNAVDISSPAGVKPARFDLQGKYLLNPDEPLKKMRAVLKILGLNETQSIEYSDKLLNMCMRFGVCANSALAVPEDTQPQHPLLQHEHDMHLPGYTLTEACEMFRSTEAHQRAVALDILCGVLVRRSEILALEPYAGRNLFEQQTNDESMILGGKYGMSIVLLRTEFASIVTEIQSTLLSSGFEVNTCAYSTHLCDIRRVVGFSVFQLVPSDLPIELPTLLLWGFRHKSNGWLYRVNVVHCLLFFLCSEAEESTAASLWSTRSGTNSTPPLPSPHGRRPEATYEQGLLDSVLERQRVAQQQEEADQQAADAGTVSENPGAVQTLALACRHSAVDGLVEAGVVVALAEQLRDCLQGLGLGTASHVKVTTADNISGLSAVLQSNVRAIFLSLSAMARTGNVSSVHTITAMLSQHWRSLKSLLDINAGGGFYTLQNALLQLLTETARRDRQFCKWLETGDTPVSTSILALILHSRGSPSVWALRLWRVYLWAHQGLHSIGELWLACTSKSSPGTESSNVTNSGLVTISLGPEFNVPVNSIAIELCYVLETGMFAALTVVEEEMNGDIDLLKNEPSEALSTALETLHAVTGFTTNIFKVVHANQQQAMPVSTEIVLLHAAVLNLVASVLGEYDGSENRCAGLNEEQQLLVQVHRACALGTMRGASKIISALEVTSVSPRVGHLLADFQKLKDFIIEANDNEIKLNFDKSDSSSAQTDVTDAQLEAVVAQSRFRAALGSYDVNWEDVSSVETELNDAIATVSDPPGVSSGILSWHRHRLQQFRVLCAVSRLARIDSTDLSQDIPSNHWALYSCAVGMLGQGMLYPVQAILRLVTRRLTNSLWPGQTHAQVLSETVMTSLLGTSDQSTAHSMRVSRKFLSSLTVSKDTKDVDACPTDWVLDAFRQQLPVSNRWALKALFLLRGSPFCQWMQVLRSAHGTFWAASDSISTSLTSTRKAPAGDLYRLLRLANAELCYRWLPESSKEATIAALEDPADDTAKAYTMLLLRMAHDVAAVVPGTHVQEGINTVISEASQESALSARGVLATQERRQKVSYRKTASDTTSSAHSNGLSEEGILELTGKLLEAALAQQLGTAIHGAVLAVLTCPRLVPWRVQERTWRELGNIGLLLLLDPPMNLWVPLLAQSFHPSTHQHPLVGRSVALALSSSRGGIRVRELLAYQFGCQIITCILFGAAAYGQTDYEAPVCIEGRSVQLLNQLLESTPSLPSESITPPEYILRDVLSLFLEGSTLGSLYAKDGAATVTIVEYWASCLAVGPEYTPQPKETIWNNIDNKNITVKTGANTVSFSAYVSRYRDDMF